MLRYYCIYIKGSSNEIIGNFKFLELQHAAVSEKASAMCALNVRVQMQCVQHIMYSKFNISSMQSSSAMCICIYSTECYTIVEQNQMYKSYRRFVFWGNRPHCELSVEF